MFYGMMSVFDWYLKTLSSKVQKTVFVLHGIHIMLSALCNLSGGKGNLSDVRIRRRICT